MTHVRKLILINLLFFVLVGCVNPDTLYAIEYGGLGVFPHVSEIDETNSLTKAWFLYTIPTNSVKEGKVTVRNTSNEAVEVKIYPVDAVTTSDGAFAPEPEGKKQVDVGAWVTLAEREFSLGPRGTKTIDFTVRVPDNVEVGDHMGAIIVQRKKSQGKVKGSGLSISTRVGVRMYITVPGDIISELALEDFTYTIQEETHIFYTSLANRGNVRIRAKGEIEITNMLGNVVAMLSIPEREVFPKKVITIPVEWGGDFFPGTFTAEAKVLYDEDRVLARTHNFFVSPSGLALWVGLGFGMFVILVILLLKNFRIRIKKI